MAKTKSPKVYLITGAASGIGAAIARLAVQQGNKVVVADINGQGAEKVAKEIGDNAIAATLDIRRPESWKKVIEATYDRFGALDVLVNNAAVVHTGLTKDVPLEKHEQTMTVNVIGPLLGMVAVLPYFNEQMSGHIVTICSMTAFIPFPGIASYAASKHALRALHFGVALEERKGPVDFTIVHPSSTETPMLEEEARTGINLAFASPSWTPEAVATIVMGAIKAKKVEVCVPAKRGRVVKAIGGNPKRLLEMIERNEKVGAENLAQRLKNKK